MLLKVTLETEGAQAGSLPIKPQCLLSGGLLNRPMSLPNIRGHFFSAVDLWEIKKKDHVVGGRGIGRRDFWGTGEVLFLHLGAGAQGCCLLGNPSRSTPEIQGLYYFPVKCLF